MNWYYADGDQQRGPVSDTEFEALVRSRVVTPETLVWHEGMMDWQPLRQVSPAPSTPSPPPPPATPLVAPANFEVVGNLSSGVLSPAGSASPNVAGGMLCSQCGRSFAPDEVIQYGKVWVCAGCKPIFIQRLREGISTLGQMVYATIGARAGAKILDLIILYIVLAIVAAVFSLLGSMSTFLAPMVAQLIFLGTWGAYETFFLGRFGATPGKMALGIKVVMADGSGLSYPRAMGRFGAELVGRMLCLLGYLMAPFDQHKRALHDHICGTRVIKP